MVSISIQSPSFCALSSSTRTPTPTPTRHRSLRVTASRSSFDVVVVGGGIIGLTIARQFLIGSDLSVAVVDKAVPCSGATGAGQGYLWMAHKKPVSDIWDLAMRSHQLWFKLAETLNDPEEILGWRKTGSLLIGRTSQECAALKRKVHELSEAGLTTEYLSSDLLFLKEPALLSDHNHHHMGAAFLPDDSQLDAHRAVAYILKGNREFANQGRYAEYFHEPVTGLIRSDGEVAGVQTLKRSLYGKKATIVAAGCWTGSLMHDLLTHCNISVEVPVKPRKGHLLVIENFDSFHLNHGIMEAGYVDHQSASAPGLDVEERMLSISMTATMDTAGNLVLGSSREFVGFNTETDEYIIRCIWERAAEFFPQLRDISLEDFIRNRKVRVGLRPYMPDGKPVIGSVPGLQNLYLAAGHEGGGLSMALGTAEMVTDVVLGKPLQVDSSAFGVKGRCC